ncbi:MAG: NIF family HAD-type phosphatase [Candidatus Microgenomates bacterium]
MKNKKIKKGIIVDLDGTLAIFKGVRDGLDFSDLTKDKVNKPIKEILIMYKKYKPNNKIIIISGRPNNKKTYNQSFHWLKKNKIPFDYLYLVDRKNIPDDENKKYFYENNIKKKYKIDFVLEDRNSVVEMWRKLGLICLQVDKTDY